LLLIIEHPEIVRGYKYAVLTPNVVEFARLCKAQGIDAAEGDPATVCQRLAKSLGGVTVIQKGAKDYISSGKATVVCNVPGGLKRSGGQGDTLTGSLGTFLAWKKAYQDRIWKYVFIAINFDNTISILTDDSHDGSLSDDDLVTLAAYGASALTRTCSRLAFEKKGRALQAIDLSIEIPSAFIELFGDDDPKL
jgi:ATP-dependent NAD(P)H-hydrate dehydratase